MNQIYLGQRAYGFAAASEIYFGKPLRDISVAEAAMLAGLPKAPSAYNPIVNPKRATTRQLYIIDRMLDNGFITAGAARRGARRSKLQYRSRPRWPLHAEFVAETARQLMYSQYGDEAYTRGLNVHLTRQLGRADGRLPGAARGILDYERRQVYRGPEAYVDLPADAADARRAHRRSAGRAPRQRRAEGGGRRSRPGRKKVVAMLADGESVAVTGEG